jgi:hypothetical protein
MEVAQQEITAPAKKETKSSFWIGSIIRGLNC